MRLAEISVRRPVFAIMMAAALLVLGAFSYRDLGLDLMPKTDPAVVTVTVNLPGASAEEIETQITKRVEEAVNTVSGIDELRATSDQGSSRVTITFTLERDIESAVQDVRDKVATVVALFPRDARPPVIQKVDPDSQAVLSVSASGPRSPKELTEIADKRVKQVLETLRDVGSVTLGGERRREIHLLLNADRLNAYGLTVDQVRTAVARQNVEIPGGSFVSGSSEVALRTLGRIRNVDDFNRVVIAARDDGSVVTFADIGRVQDTVQEIRSATRLNGTPVVNMQIRKQSGANTVEVVDRLRAAIDDIRPTLPADVTLSFGTDQSRFIRQSFEEIRLHLVVGGLLASAVVFVFMRNRRATVIAALAVPVSIFGAFAVMRAFGFTLNNMTMLALSLSTGIVIDDAIVVIENIFRFVEEKRLAAAEAAVAATSEIGLAVMATTLSLVVIFVPVAFMTGQIGRYFYSFGITAAAAILISMFVSFSLTPALCALWLTPGSIRIAHGGSRAQPFYAAIEARYERLLAWALDHRLAVVGFSAVVVASAALIYPSIGKELVPDDDQGEFNVNLRLPRGTSYQRTEEFVQPMEKDIFTLPEVYRVFESVSAGGVNFSVRMNPLDERSVSQQQVMREARTRLRKYHGARVSVSGGTDLSGASNRSQNSGGNNRLNILIQGPDIEQLESYTAQLIDKVRTITGVVDVDSNFEPTQPELRVDVNRGRAADLGVGVDSLAADLRTLVGGEEISEFKDGDDQYIVRLRLDEPFRNNPLGIGDLLVPAGQGRTARVSDVATLREERGPASIERYNRQRQISVVANIDRVPLGDVLAAAQLKVDELHLRAGYQAVFGGSAKSLAEASDNFLIAIVLAIAFIYMVLASQFNSFVHPLTIMTSLPLSLPAGLLALMAFGMTINVYSAIGLMMLFGIVKKNSILQVDYTNGLREQGLDRRRALLEANRVRLRPILMTTIAIIAGMIPIALGRGAGAGSRAAMAVTIVGGQALCLLLTLLVTPVVYSYFDEARAWSPGAGLRALWAAASRQRSA
jgi:HAE1 family hydrophobic/amphiphilic exporter-1